MDTSEIVRSYFRAWTTGNLAEARQLLADNLDFQGSIDRFQTADEFIRSLQQFILVVTEVRLIAELFGNDEAMQLYDVETRTPAGEIRTAEYFQIRGGKIAAIKLVFDATRLRAMMPSGSGG